MNTKESKVDWENLESLGDIDVPGTGVALIAIGMDQCESCDIVAEQIQAFVAKYEDTAARFYKFTTHGRSPDELQLLGQELRFFPTVLGCIDGLVAFRLQGALADAKPTDVTRLEKGFARFAARQS